MSGGGDHSLGLKASGSLWTWGENFNGQLGLGDLIRRNVPTYVDGATNWAAIAGGRDHSLGLKADATLYAWGNNLHGQLGLNNTTPRLTPTLVGTGWVAMSAGYLINLGLKAGGSLWEWGETPGGTHLAPFPVSTVDFVSVASGNGYFLALLCDGRFYVWGVNSDGQLGTGNTSPLITPVSLGKLYWVAFCAGDAHSVALKADGSLWVWGANYNGQLGLGDTAKRLSPTQVKSFNALRTTVVIPMN